MKKGHFSNGVFCISNLQSDAKIKKIGHLSFPFPCFLSPSNDVKHEHKNMLKFMLVNP